jgi:hypothetical protein
VEWGSNHPRMPWREVRRRLGLAYRLVRLDLQPVDEEANPILGKAKKAFQRGAGLAVIAKLGVRSSLQESARSPGRGDSSYRSRANKKGRMGFVSSGPGV